MRKYLIGSANFSENGFMGLNEILVRVNIDIDPLIKEQVNNSISCLSEEVVAFIPLSRSKSFQKRVILIRLLKREHPRLKATHMVLS